MTATAQKTCTRCGNDCTGEAWEISGGETICQNCWETESAKSWWEMAVQLPFVDSEKDAEKEDVE